VAGRPDLGRRQVDQVQSVANFKPFLIFMNVERTRVTEVVFRDLLEQARLGKRELAPRLQKALSRAYWEALCPGLSVGRAGAWTPVDTTPVDSQSIAAATGHWMTAGYFQTAPLIIDPALAHMRAATEALKREGWPPAFAFVYDPFWLVWRVPPLVELLSATLGAGYRLIPHIWCYYVRPVRGAKGWPPHADGYRLAKDRLTVWIPLTDATLDNGCMYVIPRDIGARGVSIGRLSSAKTVSNEDVTHLLQSSRALPARAGSVLAWDFDVIHWGSTCQRAGEPRISISAEFLHENARPADDETSVLDPTHPLPDFSDRLRLIAEAIVLYRKREVRAFRYLEFAQRLLKEIS